MPFVNNFKQKRGRLVCSLFFTLTNALRSILFFFFPLIPLFRKRIAFEEKNRQEPACQSFAKEGKSADYAFEVSSEGELEQVSPLIKYILEGGGSLEILFASPSVEEKCQILYQKDKDRVRILRLPLLTFFPWKFAWGQNIALWMTAPVLILCRYDFYPELFLYGTRKGHLFYLVSANLKNKTRLWAPLYGCFDKIVCSNETERRRFLDWGWPKNKLASYEFRNVQILSRLEVRERALAPWRHFISWIKNFSETERLIIGNAWPAEMKIFHAPSLQKKVKKGKFLVLIAPHKTGATFVKNLEVHMESPSAYVLSNPNQWESLREGWNRSPGPFIFNVSGILLEFYSLFRYAIVGGGHGKGIHSLLEPFWAGCSISCGPQVYRSSEYDFIREVSPERIQIVRDWTQLPKQNRTLENIPLEYTRSRFEKIVTWLLEDKC